MRLNQHAWMAALCLLAACGADNSPSRVEPPGEPPTATTRVLERGAAMLQDKPPVEALAAYVDGFHFYNGNLERQVEAHHFCSVVNEDVRQCVIFDGNDRDAKLMGIEYIVSRRVFEQLPAEERKLWHSHVYEVKSGTLIAPGIPEVAEHELMEQFVGTYGKTWHTWHPEPGHDLPTGHPVLMAGFTGDGQIEPGLLAARDQRFGVVTEDERKLREDIVAPDVLAGADAWQHGEVLQLTLQPTMAQTTPAREQRDAGHDVAPTEPTRRLRATKVRQLYAGLPASGGAD
ncbi:MAG TPA: OBAP family protein [Steroidobacteraceae bacterium]|nr:OBAP family protein [Steroidobacteraceae bacterium]